ncbi:30S ribosomal protein S20 [bacterium]|jgi:small subunit ribosomal protein S20|nr:30S ribosomal protein S20 [bacterium]
MANINSQKKRIRQDSKRNVRNKSLKSELKTTLKSIENGDVSSETKNQALKSLDVAFSKGVISKNYRDRNKSRISSL